MLAEQGHAAVQACAPNRRENSQSANDETFRVKRLREVDDTVRTKRAKRAGIKRALERPCLERGQKLLCFGGKSPAAVEQLDKCDKGLMSANHHAENHDPAAPPRAGPEERVNHEGECADTGHADNHRNPVAPQATPGDGYNHRNPLNQRSAVTGDGAKMRYHRDLDAPTSAGPGGAILQDPAGPTRYEGWGRTPDPN